MSKVFVISATFFLFLVQNLYAQSYWETVGNQNIYPESWIGTKANANFKDLVIKTKDNERMRLKEGGFLGIGLSSPNNIVHIHNPKNTPTVQELIMDTRLGGGGGGPSPIANTESPYFGSTGLQISNVESGTGINDGLHIGLRNGMVQGIRLNAIFNLKENADMQFFTNNSHRMTIDRKGDIGIGTAVPQATLHLKKGANSILFERQGYATFLIQQSTGNGLSIIRQGATMPDLYIANNGNVGIGTNNITHKLTVSGAIKACKVRVQLDSWCDYVFEDNYKLMPINELYQYIKSNKHLPGIQNEKELVKNDVDLAELIRLQQEKIEELFLYIIFLKEEIDLLKK